MSSQWRLSTSAAGLALGHIHFLRLPPPAVQFADFAQVQPQGDGGIRELGYKSVTFTWELMSRSQYTTLAQLIEDCRAGTSLLYATVMRNSGYDIMEWVDISGYVSLPTGQPMENKKNAFGVRNASITMNNVTIINAPSTYA